MIQKIRYLWNNIINKLSYNSLQDIYKEKFTDKVDNLNFFMGLMLN